MVPVDALEVQRLAADSTRRISDNTMAEALGGLDEIASRGLAHPGELGDLGPDPTLARALARELSAGEAVLTRLEALLRDAQARMAVLKHQAAVVLDEAHAQIVLREQRGRIQPECYANVHRFVAARNEAIADGIARARSLKAAQKAASANDTDAPRKTG
jgi:hypothetical protein